MSSQHYNSWKSNNRIPTSGESCRGLDTCRFANDWQKRLIRDLKEIGFNFVSPVFFSWCSFDNFFLLFHVPHNTSPSITDSSEESCQSIALGTALKLTPEGAYVKAHYICVIRRKWIDGSKEIVPIGIQVPMHATFEQNSLKYRTWCQEDWQLQMNWHPTPYSMNCERQAQRLMSRQGSVEWDMVDQARETSR